MLKQYQLIDLIHKVKSVYHMPTLDQPYMKSVLVFIDNVIS